MKSMLGPIDPVLNTADGGGAGAFILNAVIRTLLSRILITVQAYQAVLFIKNKFLAVPTYNQKQVP